MCPGPEPRDRRLLRVGSKGQGPCADGFGGVTSLHTECGHYPGTARTEFQTRINVMKSSMLAAIVVAGVGQSASAGWEAYRSGLVNAGGWYYEQFAVGNGTMSGGSLSQSVSTNADARATWYSFGYEGTNDQGQALTLGNSGLTSLSESVTVTGDLLQRVTGKQDAGYMLGDSLTSSTSGVSMAWYVMSQDSGGSWNVWLSNAANRVDLNSIRNGGAANFSVTLDAGNFQAFPGWPQGNASFASTVANAQYFGLLVTTATASGADFEGMKFDQWVNSASNAANEVWAPTAFQRNGNYGAYSLGTTSIAISNAVPAPGVAALLALAGVVGGGRRRSS